MVILSAIIGPNQQLGTRGVLSDGSIIEKYHKDLGIDPELLLKFNAHMKKDEKAIYHHLTGKSSNSIN